MGWVALGFQLQCCYLLADVPCQLATMGLAQAPVLASRVLLPATTPREPWRLRENPGLGCRVQGQS